MEAQPFPPSNHHTHRKTDERAFPSPDGCMPRRSTAPAPAAVAAASSSRRAGGGQAVAILARVLAVAVASLCCCTLAGAFLLPSRGLRRGPQVQQEQELRSLASSVGISRRSGSSIARRPLSSLTYPMLEEDEEEEGAAGGEKMPEYTEEDRRHMRRALELAAKGLGKTRPNPAVGCVVLDANGLVVGEGFHPKAGEPHAEVFALREAGERAKGGTAYVTLEPCDHHGRTPPCVDALLQAGVKRVVAGMVDPFPLVGGQGLQRLADNGVEVVVGCEEERCHEMNRPFLHRVTYGLPLGFLPLAYQGHCFRRPDRGALLLGEGAKVLKVADAVVVAKDAGEAVGTGLAALEELEQAGDLQASVVRVVVVPTLGLLPLEHPLWGREGVRRVVLTEAGGEGEVAAVLRAKGVEVLCETGNSGFAAVGATLQEMGMLSALWLVGPEGAKAAVSEGVVHELAVHAPLEEADEVDGVESEGGELAWAAKRFGRPMKVSVMTCDALGEDKACVLTLQVDEEAEAEG